MSKSFHEILNRIQKKLVQCELDGWLLYDFRRSNDIACQFLDIPFNAILTRRFFYWIPKKGMPIKIVHSIECHVLDPLPGHLRPYRTWQEMEVSLKEALTNAKKIAMEYSPRNAIPYISKVDAGTVDLIREYNVEVVSSADLLQEFTSVWDDKKLKSHLYAADLLDKTVNDTWKFIRDNIHANISEYDVQQFMMRQFEKGGCISSDAPICAVNENSSNPHYSPTKEKAKIVSPGDFVLIDLWCKQDIPNAVYADITRVGVIAPKPTEEQQAIFNIVREARDQATLFVKERFQQKKPLMGCEVDQCCRDVIQKKGYGEFFIHRTGHNIDQNDHGNGANIDNFETQDVRLLLPGTCFSIEPGIYLPGKFGIRLEYDIYIHHQGDVQITGGIQKEIALI